MTPIEVYVCSNQMFFAFPIYKELLIKKKDDHSFLNYTKHYLSTNQQQTKMAAWVGAGQKFDLSYKRADFSVTVNISVKT